ncbi:hypothetical protein FKM82_012795 [Ascaphus truei]
MPNHGGFIPRRLLCLRRRVGGLGLPVRIVSSYAPCYYNCYVEIATVIHCVSAFECRIVLLWPFLGLGLPPTSTQALLLEKLSASESLKYRPPKGWDMWRQGYCKRCVQTFV